LRHQLLSKNIFTLANFNNHIKTFRIEILSLNLYPLICNTVSTKRFPDELLKKYKTPYQACQSQPRPCHITSFMVLQFDIPTTLFFILILLICNAWNRPLYLLLAIGNISWSFSRLNLHRFPFPVPLWFSKFLCVLILYQSNMFLLVLF
jgi:hypothetical protein